MGDSCLPGFQGFPIQVTGWSGLEDKTAIETPNDISLQFSPTNTPSFYNKDSGILDVQGTNTFFTGGTQYLIRTVRVSAVKQEGIASMSQTTILFEFQLWGTPVKNSLAKADVALLCIPIVKKPQETPAGEAILRMLAGETIDISDTIPRGKGADIVKYNTCIETNDKDKKTITIAVAYWTNGAACTQQRINKWSTRMGLSNSSFVEKDFVPAGIPDIFGFQVLTSFTLTDDEFRTKTNRAYKTIKGMLQPYSTLVPIGAGTSEFKTGFRLIKNFDIAKKVKLETDAYKCIAIDRGRDIKGGKLLVDPATGRRLDEELLDAETGQSLDTKVEINPEERLAMFKRICIIIGYILGGCLLAILLSFFFSWMLNRKSQNLPSSKTIDTLAKLPSDITGALPLPNPIATGSYPAGAAGAAGEGVAGSSTGFFGRIGAFFRGFLPTKLPSLPHIPVPSVSGVTTAVSSAVSAIPKIPTGVSACISTNKATTPCP